MDGEARVLSGESKSASMLPRGKPSTPVGSHVMARKSLSSQVLEEIDRAAGLLRPVQDIVDPMTSHMVGAVLESLRRVESMCIAARQSAVNAVTSDTQGTEEVIPEPATPRRRATAHRAPRAVKGGAK